MIPIILVRYGEIHLKGQNRPRFEKMLKDSMSAAVRKFGGSVKKGDGRFYIRHIEQGQIPAAMEALTKVFGVHSVSPAYEMPKDLSLICQKAVELVQSELSRLGRTQASCKVKGKRSDKTYPLTSMEIASQIGGYLLEHLPGLTVDVRQPELTVYVEMREQAYLYTSILPGKGGMPLGSSGKAMLLLSGGIDSPVAGYMIASRGVLLEAVHYHSFPYTSERAKEKVLALAKELAQYTGPIRVHIVHFTDIQMAIYEKCPEEQLTILMRRYMMKIAQRIAQQVQCQALITGESIGQVASQTIASLHVTNSAVELPVFRPLIGMDKDEIIERARKIGTFETSILPYEDCCTVFVPKHPVTKPSLHKIELSERLLEEEALISGALEKTETILVEP